MLAGLRTRRLNFEGKIFRFKDVPLAVEPLQKPHPPLWYGVHSVESAARAARQGLNVVSFELPDDARAVSDSYRQAWREAHGSTPLAKNGLLRFVYVADDDATALQIARRAYLAWHKSFHFLFQLHGTAPRTGPRAPDFDGVIAQGRGIAGSPQTVANFLREQMAVTRCNYFVGQFAFGDLSLAGNVTVTRFVHAARYARTRQACRLRAMSRPRRLQVKRRLQPTLNVRFCTYSCSAGRLQPRPDSRCASSRILANPPLGRSPRRVCDRPHSLSGHVAN